MKHGKNLTRAQEDFLRDKGYDPDKYWRVKDLPKYIQVVHKVTGKQEIIMK